MAGRGVAGLAAASQPLRTPERPSEPSPVPARRPSTARPTAGVQPLPRVEPAFDFADLLEPSLASVLPAFESADFDGLDDFPLLTWNHLLGTQLDQPLLTTLHRLRRAVGLRYELCSEPIRRSAGHVAWLYLCGRMVQRKAEAVWTAPSRM